MEQNDLKLNPEKMDILLMYSWFRKGSVLDYLQYRDELDVNAAVIHAVALL